MGDGQHTLGEILSQPEVWTDALSAFAEQQADFARVFAAAAADQIVVTGCGSTYYLALTAASLLRNCGFDACAHPASEVLLFSDGIFLPKRRYALITVSRSGTTTETVRAQEAFKSKIGGTVFTVTCASDSPLARGAELVIAIDSASERSVAQTRSFSSMAVVLGQMAGALAGHNCSESARLPAICMHVIESYGELAERLGRDGSIERFFFLGADALYGIACEAMLKMKEMSLSYSEAFHTLEFRHGPMSMVNENALVVGLISSSCAGHEIQVLEEMREMGAKILAIGARPTDFEHKIVLPDDLPTWNSPVLYLPALQLLAYHRALFNGQNPDQPQNLSAVISLDNL